MAGHEGNVNESAIAETWRTLCSRPRARGDCIEWLACLREEKNVRGTNAPWYDDPMAAVRRDLKASNVTRQDVRVCNEVLSTGAMAITVAVPMTVQVLRSESHPPHSKQQHKAHNGWFSE